MVDFAPYSAFEDTTMGKLEACTLEAKFAWPVHAQISLYSLSCIFYNLLHEA